MTRHGTASTFLLAAGCVILGLASWQWRAYVFRTERAAVERESWNGVKDEFPLPKDIVPAITGMVSGAVEATVHANPFSPQRRSAPPSSGGGGGSGGGGAPVQAPPQFIYKGRILLGSRQRAVMEEVASRKTHFLEVGQEVAGFKVLDIAENQVILSDTRTGDEVILSLKKSTAP